MAKTRNRDPIRITNSALDVLEGDLILRGVVHPDDIGLIQVAPYQREILSGASRRGLKKAIVEGSRVPDIELGMRGARLSSEKTEDFGEVYTLKDPVYVIDGLQRLTAAGDAAEEGCVPYIGATIHVDRTEEWERERFRVLNANRTKLSSNVLARNMREDHHAIELLYQLSNHDTTGFSMRGRVCWKQRMKREELTSALTFLKVAGQLHGHLGAGKMAKIEQLAPALDKLVVTAGPRRFRTNMVDFFEIIDRAWGIRHIAYGDMTAHVKATFLIALARMFSSHPQYFFTNEGRELKVSKRDFDKLKTFPINDPNVKGLIAAKGKGMKMLYMLLIEHMNHKRRSRRLAITDLTPSVDESRLEGNEE